MTGFHGSSEEENIEYESIPNSSVGVNMLAGALAGITEHVATYPLDVLKTRMQFSTASVSGNVVQYMSRVYSTEGLLAFSRGLNTVILSAGPAHALYFGAYEACKEQLLGWDKSEYKHGSHASAGIVATIFHDGLVTPFDVVKQRMQLSSENSRGLWETARGIYKTEGLRAFYLSYPVTLIMSIPFQAIQFTTYEYGRKKLNPSGEYNPMSHCIAGGIAGAVASVATNPLDVAKTMLQTRGLATDNAMRHVSGLQSAFSAIYNRYGVSGFARGVQARMLSNIPSTAVAWTTIMLKYPQRISIERLENYLGEGQFADVNMQSFLKAKSSKEAVQLRKYSVPNLARIPFKEAMKGNFEPCEEGVRYGPTWSTHWFQVDITVPTAFAGSRVTLIFDPDCEAMVWSEKGETLMGITGGGGGNRHVDFDLMDKAKGGEKIKLYIEVASNGLFGEGQVTMIGPTDPNRYFSLKTAELVIFNEIALSLYWDLDVLLGIVKEMTADSQLQNDALFCANAVINSIHPGNNDSLSKAKDISTEFFEKRKRNGAFSSHQITAIGNCHIDTAWLWPYDETKRKIARSWSTQLRFLEQFPEYTFAASQMQQFEWLEQLYPELFQRILTVAEGKRFIPIGGTWVEMDCNIPSGEAFCRQFLYGQNYLKEKFGMRSSVFWLPDTFGYSSQLPQIVKSAGLEYFFTQKLSWNNINKFPHTSFYWKGLDGTSVLTHFSPADTYTAQASVRDAVFMVKNNKDKLYSNKSLLLYGNGDGGGGPLRPMMERIKRFSSVEGMPADVKFGNPEVFYQELEKTSRDLNTWQGELYFELHRGTYTSHGLIKKYNRKCELLLREVEILWSMAIARGLVPNIRYPKAELDRLWKLQLLNQFHDVLPGSSINLVYVDATKFYEDVTLSGIKLKEEALSLLVDAKASGSLNLFNPTGWVRRSAVLEIISKDVSKFEQTTFDGKAGLLFVESLDPFAFAPIQDLSSPKRSSISVKGELHYCQYSETDEDDDFIIVESVDKKFVVENGIIKVVFDAHGRIEQYLDVLNQREIIPTGELANVFRFYEDIPLFWDAWDVEVYHLEKGWNAEVGMAEIIENGPLRVVLRVVHQLSKTSTLEQRITIATGSDQVVFDNDIFWDENRKILKVQFPVAISNDNATFETQYGVLQRPTHANNSWDMAKFEVCAHKFVDLSEFGYGVALLNDCKYGFGVRGNVISMSILRAPKAPDDKCDIGRHTFRYALQPHLGSFLESDIVQKGYEFNCPVVSLHGKLKGGVSSFVTSDKPNLVIDTIKRAESGNCWVVRFYESLGGRGKARIVCSNILVSASLSNVLEEAGTPLVLNSIKSGFEIDFTPFKLITVLLSLAA